DFDANTYSLTERATIWLNKYQKDNNVTITSYQWYRVPEGGNITNNGQAITGANNDSYTLDNVADVNFEHRLVVSLNNGVNVYSEITNAWKNNGDNPNITNEIDRYFDVVSIAGNAATSYVDQSLTAVFSGSSLQKDLMPPNVSYEWQTSPTGLAGSWTPVPNIDVASYTPTATGFIRVKGICYDSSGVAHKPDRFSESVEVQSATNPLLPWQVSVTQASEYIVGQVISASHRPITTENVEYEWFRLDTASGWDSATSLGIRSSDHTIDDDDIGHFIGVKATISDGTNPEIEKYAVSQHPVQKTNSGSNDSYMLTAKFTSTPLYQDSTISYEWWLKKNGNIVTNPPGNISASWYLIDEPSQESVRSLWQDFSGNRLTNNSANKYLLLSLEYTDTTALAKPLTRTIVSPAIRNIPKPSDVNFWYSVIRMKPQDPINSSSEPYLEAKNNSENQAPNQGDTYTVEYLYSSDVQPSDTRTSLTELLTTYDTTELVTVSAKQTSQKDPSIEQTLYADFISTQDPAYLVRDIKLELLVDYPLNVSDTVSLDDKDHVISEVQALRDNYPVTVKYQWQYFDPNTSTQWQPVEPELDDYQDLTSLTSGYLYRLCLLSENTNTKEKSKSESNTTSKVESTLVNYDIIITKPAQPQVGIKLSMDSVLKSSVPPALFTERKVHWDRIYPDDTSVSLGGSDFYIPSTEDLSYILKATVSYFDKDSLIIERSINTSEVNAAPTSNELVTISNQLLLTLSEVNLSTGMVVSLVEHDVDLLERNESQVTAIYQWQSSLDGENWVNIDGASNQQYEITTSDTDKYIRLQLELNSDSDVVLPRYSESSNIINDNPNILPIETLALSFNSTNMSYEISEKSEQWLSNYLQQTLDNINSYQWYRVPLGGSRENNGTIIQGSTNSNHVLTDDDIGFTQQLEITLDSGIHILSSPTIIWPGADGADEHTIATMRERYFDRVVVQGGSLVPTSGQTLLANLVGSKLAFDTQPPIISYQWQSSDDGVNWQNINEKTSDSYIIESTDRYIRVVVTRQDNAGILKPDLFSDSILVDTTQPPWAISILPYDIKPIVATQLTATHRPLTNDESVSYQWYRLTQSGKWTSAQPVNGANQAQYRVTADDLNNYIGVEATLDHNSQNIVARQILLSQVSQQNDKLDDLTINIKIPSPIYEDSPLTADIDFFQGGDPVPSSDYIISKTWYVFDNPTDINNPSHWVSTDKGVVDKYVLLHVTYQDGDTIKNEFVLSDAPVQSESIKIAMESWYSKLVLAPNKPVIPNSRTALISASSLENQGQDSGLFTLELQYFEASQPNQIYSSLQDLISNVEVINWVQVKALQTSVKDPSIFRTIYSDRYSLNQTFSGTFLPPVVNKNNAPIAIDDSRQVEPSTTITLSPLDNDYDSDEGDEITLVSATSKFGTISIVDNKIQYTLPNSLPAEWYIEYVIADQHGAGNKGLIKLKSEEVQTEKPLFEEISSIELKATGLFTRIEAFSPKATDINGVPLPVSLFDGTLLLRSGSHIIYWEAVDTQRNTNQIVSQRVDVHPYVEFIPTSLVYEGTTAQIRISLSGLAPSYPVTIPIMVGTKSSSDSSDHSLASSTKHDVVITSGTEGILEFDIYQDNINEGEEKLHLIFADNIHTGPLSDITIDISEDEQPISLDAYFYDSVGNTVSITTPSLSSSLNIILDSNVPLNSGNDIVVDWHYSGPDINEEILGQTTNYEPLILPELNQVGRYDFTFTAYSLSSDQQPIVGKTSLRVIEEIELSLDLDTDNDGISDAEEGIGDFDNDMIPNYLDPIDDCELQSSVIDKSVSLVFESSPGDCIILGQLSSKIGSNSPYITTSELTGIIPEDTMNPNYSSANVFNLSIRNRGSISGKFVVPLLAPLSSESILRKYTNNNGWFDFDESEIGSNLKYAFGEFGNCPPPHSPLYQEEITVGGYCIEMTIKDGGVHDLDQVEDHNIDDPTYVYSPLPNLNIAPFNYVITYAKNDVPDTFDIRVNLCDYIKIADCQSLQVISVRSQLVTPDISSKNQSTLHLQLPSWYRSDQTLTFTVVLNGSVGTVDMNISYTALSQKIENDSDKNIKSGGLLSLSFIFYMILIIQLRCIRVKSKSACKYKK
ncbi:hypothetical protein UB34_14645, partial [Photobacterium leiognathi]